MFNHYKDMKGDEKCINWGGLGVEGSLLSAETDLTSYPVTKT